MVNWASKISVIITNPSNTDVRSRSVTHNQHTYYKGGRNGTYTVKYAQRSKQSWDIWLRLFHWTGSCSIPPCPIPTGAETAAELKDGDVTTITNLETNKEYKAMQIEGGFYVLPSKSHLANNTAFKDEKTFTLSSLQNRAFDTELGVLVRNFKGLSIGDKITLEDEIKLIRYDKDLDETFFGFEEFGGTITEWPFNGDLTSEFTVGEKVAFKFEIVKEHSDGPFETLDYIKYGLDNNGKAPKIDKFLK